MKTPPATLWTPHISQRPSSHLDAHSIAWIGWLSAPQTNDEAFIQQMEQLPSLILDADAAQLFLLIHLRGKDLETKYNVGFPDTGFASESAPVRAQRAESRERYREAQSLARRAIGTRLRTIADDDGVALTPLWDEVISRNLFGTFEKIPALSTTMRLREEKDLSDALAPARRYVAALSPAPGNADEAQLLAFLSVPHAPLLVEQVFAGLSPLTPAIVAAIATTHPRVRPVILVRCQPDFSTLPMVAQDHQDDMNEPDEPDEPLTSPSDSTPPTPSAETTAEDYDVDNALRAGGYPIFTRGRAATEADDLAWPNSVRSDKEAAMLVRGFGRWAPHRTIPRVASLFSSPDSTVHGGWNNTDPDHGLHEAWGHLLDTQLGSMGPRFSLEIARMLRSMTTNSHSRIAGEKLEGSAIVMILLPLLSAYDRLSRGMRTALSAAVAANHTHLSLPMDAWKIIGDDDAPLPIRRLLLAQWLPEHLGPANQMRAHHQLFTLPPELEKLWVDALETTTQQTLRRPDSLAPRGDLQHLWLMLLQSPFTPIDRLVMLAESEAFNRPELRRALSCNPNALADPTIYAILRRSRDPHILCNLLIVAPRGGDFEVILQRTMHLGDTGAIAVLNWLANHPAVLAQTDARLLSKLLQLENKDHRLRAVKLLQSAAQPAITPLPTRVSPRKRS